jgi:hypothetical protein
MTDEKWFASGESNIFRLSRDEVNGFIVNHDYVWLSS